MRINTARPLAADPRLDALVKALAKQVPVIPLARFDLDKVTREAERRHTEQEKLIGKPSEKIR